MPTYLINLTFTEPLLGSAPLDRKTYELYILPKMPVLPPDEAVKQSAEELDGISNATKQRIYQNRLAAVKAALEGGFDDRFADDEGHRVELWSAEEALAMTKLYNEKLVELTREGAGNGMDSKGVTGFLRNDDGQPILMDYVIQGFAKGACGMMRRVTGSKSAKLTSYKAVIDGLLFPAPRQIVLNLPPGTEIAMFSRPLRAETAQGPRVAIATSEKVPAGTTCAFTIDSLGVITEEILREWFDYGAKRGIGGWRNGGWGRISYTMSLIS